MSAVADNAEMSVVRLKVERALGPLADSLERELEKVDGELYTQSIRSEHHWATGSHTPAGPCRRPPWWSP